MVINTICHFFIVTLQTYWVCSLSRLLRIACVFKKWTALCMMAYLMLPSLALGMQPRLRAEMHPSLPLIKGQLQGTLSFYHGQEDRLEEETAEMEKTKLPLVFLFNAPLSEEERALYHDATDQDQASVYRFLIPFPDPGIHSLPSIRVKTGKGWVYSIPSTYQVSPGAVAPFLQLQAFVSPSLRLFPGQRAKFVYRITYNSSIQLNVEELPLLKAQGFERIGSERLEEKELSHATMQEITQEVRALQPGAFSFPASRIEGVRFSQVGHEKRYDPTPLQDKVDPITVEVLPFPEAGKPFFFTGGLGPLTLQVKLLTKDSVRIGDLCKIAIDLQSSPETLDTFTAPNLNCQAGFQGFFQIDPQVQVEPIDNKTRRYLYYLRPLTSHTIQIPAIEVASFDPKTLAYMKVRSLPLPLQVKTTDPLLLNSAFAWNFPLPKAEGGWRIQLARSKAKSLDPLLLTSWKESSSWTLTLYQLIALALAGALLLLLQVWGRPKVLQWIQEHRASPSVALLKKREWLAAFMHRLYEEKWIPSPDRTIESLPKEGKVGEVRHFLMQLQALKFGPHAANADSSLLEKEAHLLYARMKRSS